MGYLVQNSNILGSLDMAVNVGLQGGTRSSSKLTSASPLHLIYTIFHFHISLRRKTPTIPTSPYPVHTSLRYHTNSAHSSVSSSLCSTECV